jgi:hypothetical protein
MILSHRWRFIFIKGRKVAGTSVEIALSTLCGPDDIVTPITPRDEVLRFRAGGQCRNYAWDAAEEGPYRAAIARFVESASDRFELLPHQPYGLRYYNHISLRETLQRYGGDLTGYRVFCVERSPYSKALSFANMRSYYNEYTSGGAMRADHKQLSKLLDAAMADGALAWMRNIDLYRGRDGHVAARVLRYAELPNALHRFLAELGAPMPVLPHVKKGLMSDTLDPRELLRTDQIASINDLFREEFQTFGYPMIDA